MPFILADGPVDGLALVRQRLAQELRDKIDYGRMNDAAIAQVLRQALASNAAPLIAAALIVVGAWSPHQHQGDPHVGDDDL